MPTSSIVSKTASMLEIICASAGPLRFGEAVNRSGLPKSSAHRILANLVDEQLVTFDPNDHSYSPGRRLLDWAAKLLNRSDLPSLAASELEALNRHTGAHVCLSVLQDGTVLYLKTLDSHEPYRFAPRVGERSPLHCTAAGKAILANLRKTHRDELLKTLRLERFTEHTIVSRTNLRTELARVHARGFAVCDREEFLQISGVAAPVFGHEGEVVAAISIWNVEARQNLDALLRTKEQLIDSADKISQRLGFRPAKRTAGVEG